jgi:hypothetical protein
MEVLKILLMISNYFHDLAVALLASNLLVIYLLGRLVERSGGTVTVMPVVFRKLSIVTYGALAYILLGGAVRAYFFMDFEWNPAVGKGQVAALIVKHIILVGVVLFGLVIQLKYVKKYGAKS